MPWDISFHAWGEYFYPSKIKFSFSEDHDTGMFGTLGRSKNQPAPYGSAIFRVPPNIPNEERIAYLIEIILPIMPDILRAGATDCKLDIVRYYSTQCNEELSAEEIALIARLKCPLTYSAVQVYEEEELEMKGKLEDY